MLSKEQFIESYRREKQCAAEIRPSTDPARLSTWLERLEKTRGRQAYYPYLESGRGNGPYVELVDGSVKLDFISGIGTHFFGWAHPEMKWAAIEGLIRQPGVIQGNLQFGEDYIRMSENAVVAANARRPTRLTHAWIAPIGAMCNENALKMVRQKRAPAYRVLTFHSTFLGRTQTLAELTDNDAYREGLPQFDQVTYIPFYNRHDPVASTKASLDALDEKLKRASEYAVFVCELIQGEGGINVAPPEYLREVCERVSKHGIPIWFDEIQTFGRTGEFFAFQRLGLEQYADVVTAGKMIHACVTLFTRELNPKANLVSGTFSAGTAELAVGNWVLRTLDEGGFLGPQGKVRQLEVLCRDELTRLSQNQCRGLMTGIIAVGAMAGFQVYDGSPENTRRFLRRLFEKGVLGFTCGHNPMRVRFLLPGGVLSQKDLLYGLSVVAETLREGA
jgi:acetylornithine/N-succinyldiaminopimelate aminotransferase